MVKDLVGQVKENSPLAQLFAVLVLVVIVGYQQTMGQQTQQQTNANTAAREVADKDVVDLQLIAVNDTLKRIEKKLDQLDPISREVAGLKIRVGSLEQMLGGQRVQEERP